MDSARTVITCTLEDLRDPEKRSAYEEASTVKNLQKNLSLALQEARDTIDSFKELCHNCSLELLALKEKEEKDLSLIIPSIEKEIERITDHLRNEIVSQNSENCKLGKQAQSLIKEKSTLQQLANEAQAKFDKAESSMIVR